MAKLVSEFANRLSYISNASLFVRVQIIFEVDKKRFKIWNAVKLMYVPKSTSALHQNYTFIPNPFEGLLVKYSDK